MSETTQEEREHIRTMWEYVGRTPNDLWARCLNDANRLARIEVACLLRSEIDAPEWALLWCKWDNGDCEWWDMDEELEPAPDFRPNESGSVMLPIVGA